MKVFGPSSITTGNLAQQPHAQHTTPEYYFDAQRNYLVAFLGCLDATDMIPTGGTRKSREWKHNGEDFMLLGSHLLRGGCHG